MVRIIDNTVQMQNDDNKLVNENLLDLFKIFAMKHETLRDESYFILNKGLPDGLFNVVYLPQIHNVESIGKINDLFSQKSPFYWWTEEGKLSEKILIGFDNAKYSLYTSPGMILDLNRVVFQNIKTSYEIVRITNLSKFKEWVGCVAQGFGISKDGENMCFNKLSEFVGNTDKFIPIGVYADKELIATTGLFIEDGTGGIYCTSVDENYRHKGIGKSLYVHSLELLKTFGIEQAVSLAITPTETNIAKDIGFNTVNYNTIFEWHTENNIGNGLTGDVSL